MSAETGSSRRRRLVVGISGSSAPQLGIALLEALHRSEEVETHLVVSEGARRSIELEAGLDPDRVAKLATVEYDHRDLAAAISSGSFLTDGMVVIPCSMRTLAAVATGNATDLLVRAADVTLKERRRLVLVTRESPLNLVHIRNMEVVTLAGATVMPPVLGFYHRPKAVEDLVALVVGKVLDQFGISHDLFRRWGSAE
jgi:polyprenyl P-hydroxybenzoate/phenylacrylic acid decarboxylase-like protein